MKNLLRLMLFTIAWFGTFGNTLSIYGSEGVQREIRLDKKDNKIIAPEAQDYEWYLNGVRLEGKEQILKINSPGTYEVIMTSENGDVKSSVISLGMTRSGEVYRIYLLGDSTVSPYSSGWYPLTGWGMMLPYFFDSSVVIKNKAIGGLAAKSFYNYYWAPVRDSLKQGDFVFIQFGINDADAGDPEGYTLPFTTFKQYLTYFVNETQAKGAFPVLVSTVRRNSWTNDSTLYDAWHDYPVATRQLAGELNVPLIDLDSLSVPLYVGLGPDYVGPFIYMNLDPGEYPNFPSGYSDNVHFQEVGATEMARLVIDGIMKYSEDTIMNRLIPHIKPVNKVATSTNFPEAALISRTAEYPEGIPVTVKAKIDPAYDLLEWQDGDGNTLGTTDRIRFTMGADTLSVIAILDDDPTPDCADVLNGTAYFDACGDCVEGTTGVLPCNSETPEGTYKLTSVRSALCIQDGEDITQEECTSEDSQFWEIIKDGVLYKIRNLESGEYLRCDDPVSRTKVSSGTGEFLWRMEKIGTDSFQIVPKDNPDVVLEVFGTSNPGLYLRLYIRTDGTNQKFVLWESDPANCSGYPCATALEEYLSDALRFKIVPNPAASEALLEFTSVPEYPVTLEIYNLQGKRVFSRSDIRETGFRFGHELPEGVYIAKVLSGLNYFTLKFVKY